MEWWCAFEGKSTLKNGYPGTYFFGLKRMNLFVSYVQDQSQ